MSLCLEPKFKQLKSLMRHRSVKLLMCCCLCSITPIFTLSSVSGESLDLLKVFLNILPPLSNSKEQEELMQQLTEFQVRYSFHSYIQVFTWILMHLGNLRKKWLDIVQIICVSFHKILRIGICLIWKHGHKFNVMKKNIFVVLCLLIKLWSGFHIHLMQLNLTVDVTWMCLQVDEIYSVPDVGTVVGGTLYRFVALTHCNYIITFY